MIVKHAKDIARQWVIEEGTKTPGFVGAYRTGSANSLPDDAELPASSDVDISIVLSLSDYRERLGKFVYGDLILDVAYRSHDRIESPYKVLGDYHLAGGFRTPSIISDPSGELTRLQAAVSKDFARRRWVHKRCEHAMSNALGYLQRVDESEAFHDQVTCWLFGTTGAAHILLAAGLKDPTVRRSYVAVRKLLSDYGHSDFYASLLDLLGCAQMSPERVEYHLDALSEAFDAAKAVVKTPYRFATDISDIARPISIDGSRELIELGLHREAVYWIVATYSRCQTILHNDASQKTEEKFSRGFRELLADLGITSFSDLQRRSERTNEYLPRVRQVAETIMASNPGIED